MLTRRIDTFWSEDIDTFGLGVSAQSALKVTKKNWQYSQRFFELY